MNESGHTRFLGGGIIITHLLDKSGCRENNNMERSRNLRRGVCVCVCVSQWLKQAGNTGAVIPVHLPMVLPLL